MNPDLITIIVLIIFFIIFVYKKINYRFVFFASILFLFITALYQLANNADMANNMAKIVYYLLIMTVGLVLAEHFLDFWKTKGLKLKK